MREIDKLVIERLYTKIDYLKATRLRIPLFVAVASFALTTLSTRAPNDTITNGLFGVGFGLVFIVGCVSLYVIKSSFDANVQSLKQRYLQVGIDPDLAEPASRIWWLLGTLILIACALPAGLVFQVDFAPIVVIGN